MPDYDLGRAHGEIIITADTSGADQAAASMAAVDAESKALNEHLTEVTDALNKTEQQHGRVGQAAYRHKTAIQDLNKQYNQFNQEYQQATQRTLKVHAEWKQAFADKAPLLELMEWKKKYQQAQEDENKALERAQNSYAKLGRSIQDARAHIRNFSQDTQNASQHIKNFTNDLEKINSVVERVAHTLTNVLGTALKSLAAVGGVGAAGGLLGLLGGGGIQGIAGFTAAITQLSGAIALLPAAAGGGALALGTLAVGMHGVMDALKSIDDPAKFAVAIRQLAPAAQEVMIILSHFTDSYRGVMREVQQSLFAPIVDDIRPLIQTWLPLLMQAGQQIGTVFGQAMHQVLQFMTTSGTLQAMNTFVGNITQAMRGLLPAIQPVLEAFKTLGVVGSQFLPQISAAIVKIANEFNQWIQEAAASGKLQQWIQGAIDGFGELFSAIKNFGEALGNISAIANQFGGGFLNVLKQLATEFNKWTQSAQGQQTLTEFFKAAHAAATALGPVLSIVANAIGQLFTNLMNLGASMGPGIASFFTSLGQALNILGQALVASGPALGEILTTLGEALVQIVQSVGPALPNLFRDFADVLRDIAPTVKTVADAIGTLLNHLTPTELKWILGITLAFIALSSALGTIAGAIGTATTIIGGLTAAAAALDVALGPLILIILAVVAVLVILGVVIYEVVTHWDTIKKKMSEVWETMKQWASWIGNEFVLIWRAVELAIEAAWKAISQFFGTIGTVFTDAWNVLKQIVSHWWDEAFDWGKHIVQNIIDGIKSMFKEFGDTVADLFGIARDHGKTQSPAKRGPLHDDSPDSMGQAFATNYAKGIQQGTPAVTDASSSMAGAAVSGATSGGTGGTGGGISTTGIGFTTSGETAASGKGTEGVSGFDQYIKWITTDMEAWKNIFQHAFNLALHIGNIMMDGAKIVASLWNRGDNPMTRPGGFFGRPLTPQEQVYGVPQVQEPGHAPLPWGEKLPGGPGTGAQEPAGVPQVGPQGQVIPQAPAQPPAAPTPAAPTPAPPAPAAPAPAPPTAVAQGTITAPGAVQGGPVRAGPPPANPPPPPPPPAGPASVPGTQLEGPPIPAAPGDSPLVAALKQKGFSPQLIRLIVGFSAGEGLNPSGNPTLGFNDAQLGGDASLQGHVNALAKQFKDRADVAGPFPQGGTDQQQAEWIGHVVGQHGAPGEPSFPEYTRRIVAAMPGQPIPLGGPAPPPPPAVPPGGVAATQGTITAPGAVIGGRPTTPPPPPPPPPGGQAAPTGGPPTGGGQVQLNLGDKISVQTNSIDCGPASARIVLQGDAQFAGQGAKQIEDMFSAAYGTGQGPQTYTNLLNKYVPQANYTFTPSAGSTPQALMSAIQTSVNAGFAPILNYNAPGPIQGAKGGPIGSFEQGGQIEHFVVVQGYDPTTNRVIIRDEGVLDPKTGQASVYSITAEEALRLSQNQGLIAARPAPGVRGATPYQAPDIALSSVQQPFPQGPAPTPTPTPTPAAPPGVPTTPQPNPMDAGRWIGQPPPGWDMSQPIPLDVRRTHNIPDNVPPIYYSAPPAPTQPVPAVPGSAAPSLQPGQPNLLPPNPQYFPGYQAPPGVSFVGPTGENLPTQTQSPADIASAAMSAVGTIGADVFTNIEDIIKSIGATADITDTLVRGIKNTEDIVKLIGDVQVYIKTAADVAKTVGDVLGEASKFVGAGAAGDPTGGASGAAAALGAASAIAGLVSEVLGAVNEGISLGVEVYHEVGKYVGVLEGFLLGGAATGPLSGNVRMLLNTNTGEIYTYSEDNPLNKNIIRTPFNRAYTAGPGPQVRNTQLNIYAGPSQQTPLEMMSNSMWLVGTGAPQVASISAGST